MRVDTHRAERVRLFGRAAGYLDVVDAVLPRLASHRYRFLRNDVVVEAAKKGQLSPVEFNRIHAGELLDNSHLAATTSLIRTSLWARGMCSGGKLSRVDGSSTRIDLRVATIGDGLLNVGASLAFRL